MDSGDPYWLEQPFGRWRARWDLIQRAAYAPHDDDGVQLERGEVRVSINFLAARWGWTPKQVRTFLARLADSETIALVRRTAKGSVYRVSNYDAYQSPTGGHPEGHSEGHSTDVENKGVTDTGGTPGGTPADTAKGTPEGTPKGTKDKEGSKNEGNRTKGGKKKATRARRVAPVLGETLPDVPASLDTPDFRRALERRIAERERAEKRYRVTPESLEALYEDLEKVRVARGIEHSIFCLNRATQARHQGVVFKEDRQPDGNGAQGALFKPAPQQIPPDQQGGGRKF